MLRSLFLHALVWVAVCTEQDLSGNGYTSWSQFTIYADTTILYLNDNKLSSFQGAVFPSGLQYLYIAQNQLTTLSGANFPSSLQYLYLFNNRLSSLSGAVLPSSLLKLSLSSNDLTSISNVVLPSQLQYLDVSDNKITTLTGAVFPSGLLGLSLVGNHLTALDGVQFPSGSQYILLDSNMIRSVNELVFPSSLQKLSLTGNSGLTTLCGLTVSNSSALIQSIVVDSEALCASSYACAQTCYYRNLLYRGNYTTCVLSPSMAPTASPSTPYPSSNSFSTKPKKSLIERLVVLIGVYVLACAPGVFALQLHPHKQRIVYQNQAQPDFPLSLMAYMSFVASPAFGVAGMAAFLMFMYDLSQSPSSLKYLFICAAFLVTLNVIFYLGLTVHLVTRVHADKLDLHRHTPWLLLICFMSAVDTQAWILLPWDIEDLSSWCWFPSFTALTIRMVRVCMDDIPRIVIQTVAISLMGSSFASTASLTFSTAAVINVLYLAFTTLIWTTKDDDSRVINPWLHKGGVFVLGLGLGCVFMFGLGAETGLALACGSGFAAWFAIAFCLALPLVPGHMDDGRCTIDLEMQLKISHDITDTNTHTYDQVVQDEEPCSKIHHCDASPPSLVTDMAVDVETEPRSPQSVWG